MDLTPLIPQGAPLIQRYGQGGFVIGGQNHAGPVVVLPDGVRRWVFTGALHTLCADDLAPFLESSPSPVRTLLLGTGLQSVSITQTQRQSFRDKGMVVEVMDTGAACRTWNVLIAEGREVAAALIPV